MGHAPDRAVGAQSERHTPAMLTEVLDALSPRPGGIFIDATLGDGGHAEAILEAISPHGRLLGIDRDQTMLLRAQKRLAHFGDRFLAVHGNFVSIAELAERHGFTGADGVLFDFGVASYHFDDPVRGFSFREDAPLDMRLDETQERDAASIVNHANEAELERILREYGEEPQAARIAREIVHHRPITTTRMFADLISNAKARRSRSRSRVHPATQSFQAIRIAVNDELHAIDLALPGAFSVLTTGGVLATIAYHSLEDRIVKRFFRERASH